MYPIGTVVYHEKTKRLGVVVSPASPVAATSSPVQFGTKATDKHDEVPDKELKPADIKTRVSYDVLQDNPDLVKDEMKKGGVFITRLGSDEFLLQLDDKGNILLRQIARYST